MKSFHDLGGRNTLSIKADSNRSGDGGTGAALCYDVAGFGWERNNEMDLQSNRVVMAIHSLNLW